MGTAKHTITIEGKFIVISLKNNLYYIISENDIPVVGDKVINKFSEIHILTSNDSKSYAKTCKKILVSYNEFSPKCTEAIKRGLIKSGDKLLIECDNLGENTKKKLKKSEYYDIKFDKKGCAIIYINNSLSKVASSTMRQVGIFCTVRIVDTNGVEKIVPKDIKKRTHQECLDWGKQQLDLHSTKRRVEIITHETFSK